MHNGIIRLAAVTSHLDWAQRTVGSHAHFDLEQARRHIERHTAKNLALMAEAGRRGADLVLAPEYFCASELFTTTPDNRRQLLEPVDGPTGDRLAAVAKQFGMYVGASYNLRHEGAVKQVGVIYGRQGGRVGLRIKGDALPPQVFDLDFGKVGLQVCADFEKPRNALALGEGGAKLVLLCGCGFMGRFAEQFVVVRALEHKTVVVYSDESQAMIVLPDGAIVARTASSDDIIIAEVALGGT